MSAAAATHPAMIGILLDLWCSLKGSIPSDGEELESGFNGEGDEVDWDEDPE